MGEKCPTCGQATGLPIGVDWEDFALSLRLEMARANLSLRQLASEIGVDQATIHRVAKHGKPVSVENYLALWNWIERAALATEAE